MIQDEDSEGNVLGRDGLHTDHDDLRLTIEHLYPERQMTSRFSIHNPHARFSRNHDQLRQTIKEYREIGKLPGNQHLMSGIGPHQSFIPGQKGPVFQKQGVLIGNGAPTSSLFACENLMNQTLSESFLTHNNIDELFNKASNLEAQAKLEDDFFAQLQVNQFRVMTFPG